VQPLLQWTSSEYYTTCVCACVCVCLCVCVFVDLGIQHAMHMRHIIVYGLSSCTKFFHIIS